MKQSNKIFLRFGIFLLLLTAAAFAYCLQREHIKKQNVTVLGSDAACEEWLRLHGWETADAALTETVMPDKWQTEPGQNWLHLQHMQGFSPEDYAGKPVMIHTYTVRNAGTDCRAVLWLCENELAGAYICRTDTQVMQSVF